MRNKLLLRKPNESGKSQKPRPVDAERTGMLNTVTTNDENCASPANRKFRNTSMAVDAEKRARNFV